MVRYRARSRNRFRFSGGGEEIEFTPASLSGHTLWLDPGDTATITQSGGLVSQWNDKSGINNNGTATSTLRPTTGTESQNGMNVFSFSGTNSITLPSGLYGIPNSGYTMFIMFKSNTTAGNFLFSGGAGASNFYCLLNDSSNTSISVSSGSGAAQTILRAKDSDWHLLIVTKDNSTALTLGLDNMAEYQVSNSGNVALTSFFLGGSSSRFNGLMGEVNIYNRQLAESEIAQMISYYFTKWAFGPAVQTPVTTPLRVASVQNRIPGDSFILTGCNRIANRIPHRIGQDMKNFVISLSDFFMTSVGEANVGNNFTVIDMSVESCFGTVIPITFSGNRSITVNNGDADVHSDPIPASAFGRSFLPRSSTFWVKFNISVPNIADKIPVTAQSRTDYATTQMTMYSAAATTISSTDVKGPYTVTSGAALTNINASYCPMLFGNPVVDGRSFVAIGDSIVDGVGDNSSGNIYGKGFIQRSTRNASYTDPISMLNLAKGGAFISAYTTGGTKYRTFLQYAKHGISEPATNDLNTVSDSDVIITRLQALWTIMRSYGLTVRQTELMLNTDTTDAYATVENQTPKANWDVGATRDQVNSKLYVQAGLGNIDGVITTGAIVSPLRPNVWITTQAALLDPGTANYATTDGVHETATAAQISANEVRPQLLALS